ncbi:MAG TPA: hypothetical protein VFD58_02930 [Blastocatellia bacterium]|nr:hypothetical protein [Blastocatellia bacterium]
MKKQILGIVATLSIIITLSVAGFAGLAGRVKADIPFDFMVGKTRLPAGKYCVSRVTAEGSLAITSNETGKAASFLVRDGRTARGERTARLVFHRYGNQYFLAEIWDGESNMTQQLGKSKAEREAARAERSHLAQNNVAPEIVTVAALIGQ